MAQEGDVLYATGDSAYDLFLLRTAEVDVIRDATATDPEHLVYQRQARVASSASSTCSRARRST